MNRTSQSSLQTLARTAALFENEQYTSHIFMTGTLVLHRSFYRKSVSGRGSSSGAPALDHSRRRILETFQQVDSSSGIRGIVTSNPKLGINLS